MASIQSTDVRRLAVVVAVVAVWSSGCALFADRPGFPDVDVPADAPEQRGGEPVLERGDDGLWYAVGEFDETPNVGDTVFGRYGGEWPLEETPSPALFVGEVVESHSQQVILVHPLYEFPDIEHDELMVEVVDERGDETMGKGMGSVEAIERREPTELTISPGPQEGARQGDMYAVLSDRDSGDVRQVQLTRRLAGVCMIVEVEDDTSRCRIHHGHPGHPEPGPFEEGQEITFLEPTFGAEPREATILVSMVDDDIDAWMVEHLEDYFEGFPAGNIEVELTEQDVDASDEAFHRWHRRINTGDEPKLLLGADLEERNDERHLVLNYTGLSTAVGPGMVAAPPEEGVDMGPVDDINDDDWRGVASMLMGAVMVYRGQTAEALAHLHQALRDDALTGKWRWHTRDQYAMRWAAMDRFEEALWLVHEDEAVARASDDDQALYNAKGTRARLHDYVDQKQRAVDVADKYLRWRRDSRPDSGHLSALSMFAEMAVQAERIDETEEAVDELMELCPDGCQGDALALLAGVYWAATDIHPGLQDEIVGTMVSLGDAEPNSSMASARMFQGWTFMRDDNFDQALIAFLEAERLFDEREESPYGAARAQFYIAMTQMLRDEPQQAYEYAMEARDYMRKVGDYRSVARIYERLSEIYADVDRERPPEQYLAAGRDIMNSGLEMQVAKGDYGAAAEMGFSLGNYMFRAGSLEQARFTTQQAVTRGIRVARFDIVAMCHIFLAIIARVEGDMQLFEEELQRAEVMADYADDPYINDLLDEIRAPSQPDQDPEDDDPTQLL